MLCQQGFSWTRRFHLVVRRVSKQSRSRVLQVLRDAEEAAECTHARDSRGNKLTALAARSERFQARAYLRASTS